MGGASNTSGPSLPMVNVAHRVRSTSEFGVVTNAWHRGASSKLSRFLLRRTASLTDLMRGVDQLQRPEIRLRRTLEQ